mgnify:CR=1 FL=1
MTMPGRAVQIVTLTSDGYIEVNNAYQSISDNRVFAGGDIAKIKHQPRPRSGVFAVRAGPILAKNLRLALTDRCGVFCWIQKPQTG